MMVMADMVGHPTAAKTLKVLPESPKGVLVGSYLGCGRHRKCWEGPLTTDPASFNYMYIYIYIYMHAQLWAM